MPKKGYKQTEEHIGFQNLKQNNYKLEKEDLEELYLNQRKTQKEIASIYDCQISTINHYLSKFHIYKFPERKRQKYSSFQKNLERIKKEVNKNSLNHKEACKLVSCDFGLKKLEEICLKQDLDFRILSEVYRKIEKILFKLNFYHPAKVKIALSIYLKFTISQVQASRLSGCSVATIPRLYEEIKPYIRITEKLPYISDKPINISKIFKELEV